MIRVTLEFASAEEMLAHFNARVVPVSAKDMDVTDVVAKEGPKAPKQPKAEKPAASPAPSAEPAKAPLADSGPEAGTATETTVSPSEPAAVEYSTVASAITAAVAAGRKEHAVAVLAKFGARKGTELKPEQYADFMAEMAQ